MIDTRAIYRLEKPYVPAGAAREPLLRATGGKVPTLALSNGNSSGVFDSLRTIFTPVHLPKDGSRGFIRYGRAARNYFRGRSLSASFVVHVGLIFAIIYLPILATPQETLTAADLVVPEKIYYLPVPPKAKQLPKIAPEGLASRPLSGTKPAVVPAQGSTESHSVMSLVSRMEHPESSHQTILQPDTPPELRIKNDLKLPNMLLGKPLDGPKAPQLTQNLTKPLDVQRKTTDQQAPTIDQSSINPLMKLVNTNNPHPVLPVSGASGVAAARTNTTNGSAVAAPNVTSGSNAGDSNVLALVVDPSDSSRIAMPAGNRSGEFAVSSSPVAGSPGETTIGVTGAGAGNHGAGGELAVGVGHGGTGGGGRGSVSVATNVNGPQGTLEAELALKGVYPVPSTFKLRRNTLVISGGPTGGGGLEAYGALRNCGRISTIFLPMPARNWTMEFCQENAAGGAPAPAQSGSGAVVQMQQGIVPPQADTQFDFKRLPVPPENPKQIILRGTLKADGTIDTVQVYQSAVPEMDEAARTAFSHWKFKPAMRGGKAIPVEILVGIPVEAEPRTQPAATSAP